MVKGKKIETINLDSDSAIQPLRVEYETMQALYEAQSPVTQRFLDAQGRLLAEALMQNQSQVRFCLPDQVALGTLAHENGSGAEAQSPTSVGTTDSPHALATVPAEFREQTIGGVIERLARSDTRNLLRERLAELEGASRKAVAASARLLRFATSRSMVYAILPSGRKVTYAPTVGEEIPCEPVEQPGEVESAITQATDAIVEEGAAGDAQKSAGRGALQVPFVPDARRFFLPQFVAFGQTGNLLVNTTSQAEAHIASMQRFLSILHGAVALAPYFVADSEYQIKRYGMLGQLVNQGRALAVYQTGEMIQTIRRRAASHDLNRGLSLSLPYFDDQLLEIRLHDFVVIPAGRIMFVPAFVVRAAREEQAKVAQDTRLSPSTRRHLLAEIKMLESAFLTAANKAARE